MELDILGKKWEMGYSNRYPGILSRKTDFYVFRLQLTGYRVFRLGSTLMGARRASILFVKLGIPIQSRDPFRLPGIVPKAWFPGPVTRLRGTIDCSVVSHSRPQRPRSFWSAPRIATSGQAQRHSGLEPIRFVRLDSEHAQSDGKSVNRGLPLLDSFSTPELFSFAHDRRREELWGTLDQALSLFVVG